MFYEDLEEAIESAKNHLKNEFQNQSENWYNQYAIKCAERSMKTGDSMANIINKICR